MPIHFQGTLPHASVSWNSPAQKTALQEVREEVSALKEEGVAHAAVYSHKEGDTIHIGVATDEDARPYGAFKTLTEGLPGVKEALQNLQKKAEEQGAAPNTMAIAALKTVPTAVRQALFTFYGKLNQATHNTAKNAAHSYDRLPAQLHELDDVLRVNYDHTAFNREILDNLHELEDAVRSAARSHQPEQGFSRLA